MSDKHLVADIRRNNALFSEAGKTVQQPQLDMLLSPAINFFRNHSFDRKGVPHRNADVIAGMSYTKVDVGVGAEQLDAIPGLPVLHLSPFHVEPPPTTGSKGSNKKKGGKKKKANGKEKIEAWPGTLDHSVAGERPVPWWVLLEG